MSPIGFIRALRRAGYSESNLRAVTGDNTDLQSTLLPHSEVLLTEELADTLRTSEAGTDLCMDWADTASLGFDGEQFFLVVVDKGTEHVVTFNTKTRSDSVDLLANYLTAILTQCKRASKVLLVLSSNILVLLFQRLMFQHVFGRMLLQISFTNITSYGARLTGTDYYLPLKLAYSLLLQVICLRLLTLLALVLSPDSRNFTAKSLAKLRRGLM
jgi:hypothetical protein